MPRHFHDDDVPDVRRADDDRSSSTGLILAIVGLVVLLGLGGLAVLGFLFFRVSVTREAAEVARVEAIAERDLAAAHAAAAKAMQVDATKPVDRAAAPPAVPGPDREPEKDGKWIVLFRSDDPVQWDTVGNAAHYAVPLRKAPAGTSFLRLKRMDTGDALIVAVKAHELPGIEFPTGSEGKWNGKNHAEFGGHHLGIFQGPPMSNRTNTATIFVTNDGPGGFAGSGFGHKHMPGNWGQCYAWRGQEIAKTVFEIAVSDKDLTDEEKNLLIDGK